jgi:hypothetical protein
VVCTTCTRTKWGTPSRDTKVPLTLHNTSHVKVQSSLNCVMLSGLLLAASISQEGGLADAHTNPFFGGGGPSGRGWWCEGVGGGLAGWAGVLQQQISAELALQHLHYCHTLQGFLKQYAVGFGQHGAGVACRRCASTSQHSTAVFALLQRRSPMHSCRQLPSSLFSPPPTTAGLGYAATAFDTAPVL